MKKTRTTGQTCVGDLRLTPLDVGFDVRLAGKSVGIEQDGETYLIEGSREELIEAIEAAGYTIAK